MNFLGKQGKKLLTFTSLRLQIKESIKTLVMKFLSEFVSENAKFWKVEIFLRTQSLIAQLKQFSTTSHLNFVFGQAEWHYQLTDKFTTNWSLALCEILDWTRQIKRSIQHSIVCLTYIKTEFSMMIDTITQLTIVTFAVWFQHAAPP